MSDKKKQEHEHEEQEEVNEIKSEAVETPENGGQFTVQLETLQNQLAESEARASEYKDGWMRSQAEFQNYKKRIERDNEAMYAAMKGDILRKVLPVLDDLERAMQNRPEDSTWADGIGLIVRKLQNVLESEGVKRIEAEGKPFDPNFHEAISHEPADGVQSGYVIAVTQNGYMLGDRVIRPALVRVAQ